MDTKPFQISLKFAKTKLSHQSIPRPLSHHVVVGSGGQFRWCGRAPGIGGPLVTHFSETLGKVRPLKEPWPGRGSNRHHPKARSKPQPLLSLWGTLWPSEAPTFPEAFASVTHPSGNEDSNAFSEPARVRPVPSLPEVTSCT